jgi:hypothetical protein
MDNMLIISTNMNDVNDTKKYLTSKFRIKDLNEVDIILGIKVKKKKHSERFCSLSISLY